MAIEIALTQGQRVSIEQGMVALAAGGLLIEFGAGHPVDGVAVRANDVEHISHA